MDNPTADQWAKLVQQNQILLEYLNGQRDLVNDQRAVTRLLLGKLQSPLTPTKCQTHPNNVGSFFIPFSYLNFPAGTQQGDLTRILFYVFKLNESTEEIEINWGFTTDVNAGGVGVAPTCMLLGFMEAQSEIPSNFMMVTPRAILGEYSAGEGRQSAERYFHQRMPCNAKYICVVGLGLLQATDALVDIFQAYFATDGTIVNPLGDLSRPVNFPFSLVEYGR